MLKTKREPIGLVGRLQTKIALFQSYAKSNLRSQLAIYTLLSDYKHQLRNIRLGDIHPTPWFTYPFLEHLLLCDISRSIVFEYGGGASTLFWSQNALKVITVESSPIWYKMLMENDSLNTLNNTKLIYRDEKFSYCDSILDSKENFDIIVIDGAWRFSCTRSALSVISNEAVIILDNSDWCPNTVELLASKGFSRIDFSGFGPSNQFTWTTSLFFRGTHNCLLNPKQPPRSKGQADPEFKNFMFPDEDSKLP